MKRYCPNCGNEMLADEMNPVSDLAKCDQCGTVNSISALAYEPVRRKSLYEVPDGSKFTVEQAADKSLTIHYPPGGWSWMHIFLIPFTLFWIGFVAFWTVMAVQISYLIGLFAVPFWYVGLSMVKGVYRGIKGWEEVLINRSQIEIRKGTGNKYRSKFIPLSEIEEIRLNYKTKDQIRTSESFENIKPSPKKVRSYDRQPALITEKEPIYFFESASDFEQDWVIALLNDLKLKLS